MLLQVMLNGSRSMHAVSDAGVSVRSAAGDEVLHISTLDTALVSPGAPTPLPQGRHLPDMHQGVHFNLVNNLWGTNYVSSLARGGLGWVGGSGGTAPCAAGLLVVRMSVEGGWQAAESAVDGVPCQRVGQEGTRSCSSTGCLTHSASRIPYILLSPHPLCQSPLLATLCRSCGCPTALKTATCPSGSPSTPTASPQPLHATECQWSGGCKGCAVVHAARLAALKRARCNSILRQALSCV